MLLSVSTFFKIEKDPFYIRGYEKGFEIGLKIAAEQAVTEMNLQWVMNLIVKSDVSDEQIADFVNVPIAFVQEVRSLLKKIDGHFYNRPHKPLFINQKMVDKKEAVPKPGQPLFR